VLDDAVLLIDANRYLQFYGLRADTKLLKILEERKSQVFVPTQIVEEVYRNKLAYVVKAISESLKEVDDITRKIPAHLFGFPVEFLAKLRITLQEAATTKELLKRGATDMVGSVARSEEEISLHLEILFGSATPPTEEQLQRARDRKERGNPPGKMKNALGDQIVWEQLLSRCTGCTGIWIITDDGDYHVKYDGQILLDPLLHRELKAVCAPGARIHCFDRLDEGLKHFAKSTNVKIENVPTETESEEIRKELDALPPMSSVVATSPAGPASSDLPTMEDWLAYQSLLSGHEPRPGVSEGHFFMEWWKARRNESEGRASKFLLGSRIRVPGLQGDLQG
jgi:hypothetical protein